MEIRYIKWMVLKAYFNDSLGNEKCWRLISNINLGWAKPCSYPGACQAIAPELGPRLPVSMESSCPHTIPSPTTLEGSVGLPQEYSTFRPRAYKSRQLASGNGPQFCPIYFISSCQIVHQLTCLTAPTHPITCPTQPWIQTRLEKTCPTRPICGQAKHPYSSLKWLQILHGKWGWAGSWKAACPTAMASDTNTDMYMSWGCCILCPLASLKWHFHAKVLHSQRKQNCVEFAGW